jgi:hypothetical protein
MMSDNDNAFPEKTNITESYRRNYVLYLPVVRDGRLKPGAVRVRVEQREDLDVEGALNFRGALSGMARIYSALGLKDGDEVTYRVESTSEIRIKPPRPPSLVVATPPFTAPQTVFGAKNLKHIHFEAFRPENLLSWQPQAEVDVYMAFGILQEYTEFKYCCGINQAVLNQLGAKIEPKPDAVLIDRVTGEYLIAEFETYASSFQRTHKAEDIDVLVCWEDDESDKTKLPKRVLSLSGKAREAALEILGLEPEATN